MPKTTFKMAEPVIEDIFDYVKLQDLGGLTIVDKDSPLLRHSIVNQSGKIVANIVAKDRVAMDSNSIEVLDPAVYWFFFDMATRYEIEYKPDSVAINCTFTEDLIPSREA